MDKKAVGLRLKSFLKDEFGTLEKGAEYLGTTAGSLSSSYINGKSLIGAEIIAKLITAGCNLEWLFFGEKSRAIVKDSNRKYISIDQAVLNNQIFYPEFPVVGQVPAGYADIKIIDNPDYKKLDFDPRKYFWLEIDEEYGFSMQPAIRPHESVLCAYETKKFFDGDMVAVLWDGTKGAIKIMNLNSNLKDVIVLDSINQAERPIVLKKNQVKAVYKVVLILKK